MVFDESGRLSDFSEPLLHMLHGWSFLGAIGCIAWQSERRLWCPRSGSTRLPPSFQRRAAKVFYAVNFWKILEKSMSVCRNFECQNWLISGDKEAGGRKTVLSPHGWWSWWLHNGRWLGNWDAQGRAARAARAAQNLDMHDLSLILFGCSKRFVPIVLFAWLCSWYMQHSILSCDVQFSWNSWWIVRVGLSKCQ